MTDTPEVVRMVYVGQRIYDHKSPPAFGWLEADADSNKAPHLYSRVRGYAIGSIYNVRVKRDESGEVTSAYAEPAPEFTGERTPDREQTAAWQALDLDAKNRDKLRKLQSTRKRANELDLALRDMYRIMEKAPSFFEAEQIANAVRSKLMQNWGRPK